MSRRTLIVALLALGCLAGLALILGIFGRYGDELPGGGEATGTGSVSVAALSWHDEPRPPAPLSFSDADGEAIGLDAFRGRTVLLNVWATWCIPCRQEMPSLDRLQAELGGPDFEVVALSIDRGGAEAVRPFFAELGLTHLGIYLDAAGASMSALGLLGLPTTLLIDAEGREVARATGALEWDGSELKAEISQAIKRDVGS